MFYAHVITYAFIVLPQIPVLSLGFYGLKPATPLLPVFNCLCISSG